MRPPTRGLTLLLIAGLGGSIGASAAETHRDHGLVDTRASRHAKLHSVDLADVRWTEGDPVHEGVGAPTRCPTTPPDPRREGVPVRFGDTSPISWPKSGKSGHVPETLS